MPHQTDDPYWSHDRIHEWDGGYNDGSVRWDDTPRGWEPAPRRQLRDYYSYSDLSERFQSEYGGGPGRGYGARPRFSAGFWYPSHLSSLWGPQGRDGRWDW